MLVWLFVVLATIIVYSSKSLSGGLTLDFFTKEISSYNRCVYRTLLIRGLIKGVLGKGLKTY